MMMFDGLMHAGMQLSTWIFWVGFYFSMRLLGNIIIKGLMEDSECRHQRVDGKECHHQEADGK